MSLDLDCRIQLAKGGDGYKPVVLRLPWWSLGRLCRVIMHKGRPHKLRYPESTELRLATMKEF